MKLQAIISENKFKPQDILLLEIANPTKVGGKTTKIIISKNQFGQQTIILLEIANPTKVGGKTTEINISENQFKQQDIKDIHERGRLNLRYLAEGTARTIIAWIIFILRIAFKSIYFVGRSKETDTDVRSMKKYLTRFRDFKHINHTN